MRKSNEVKDFGDGRVLGSPRERLIQTAIGLFRQAGIRATGIDLLLAQAGVAKMSLYSHFRSKEDLVIAVIDTQSNQLISALEEAVALSNGSVAGRLGAIFDVVQEKVLSPEFLGCEFIRALSEYPDPPHPINEAVVRHRKRLLTLLAQTLSEGRCEDSEPLASEIMLLMDGALVSCHASHEGDGVKYARKIAMTLIG